MTLQAAAMDPGQVLDALDPHGGDLTTDSGAYVNGASRAESDDPLDGEKARRLWGRLRDWRAEEIRRQRTNRQQQAIDHDFYDHIQWQQEHAAELEARGQAPLTYNRVALLVDFAVGAFIRMIPDWQILPRGRDDDQAAQTKTLIFKYLSDVNNIHFKLIEGVKDALKGGAGYAEAGIEPDPTKELIFLRQRSWRHFWPDSRSKSADYNEDARYLIADLWLDADVARHLFWKRRAVISRSIQRGVADDGRETNDELQEEFDFEQVFRHVQADSWNSFENIRPRVLISECWYKVPVRMQVLRGGVLNGKCYEPANEVHKLAVAAGESIVQNAMRMQMRYAFWCANGMLAEGESPYNHDLFPVQPLFYRRRDRDNMPYGKIRGCRDAQEDMNQRLSRALWRTSSKRVTYEAGTFVDEDEAMAQIARPDARIKVNAGKMDKFKVESDAQLADADVALMHIDAEFMEWGSGVTNEALGHESNAASGKAVRARQDQTSISSAEFGERFAMWFTNIGRILLSLIEQFWTEERTIRITDERTQQPQFIDVNKAQFNDLKGIWEYINDVTKSAADFVVSKRDYSDSAREAMFQSLIDLLEKMPPQMAMQLLDLAIEIHPNVPNKKAVLTRIRKISGVPDPDVKLTPEEAAAAQRKAAMQAKMEDLQLQHAEAAVQELQGKARKLAAEGKRLSAAELKDTVTAIYEALQAGQIIATVPQVTPAADQVLQGAGFTDASGGSLNTNDDPALQYVNDATGSTSIPKTMPVIPAQAGGPAAPRQGAGAAVGIQTPTGADNVSQP